MRNSVKSWVNGKEKCIKNLALVTQREVSLYISTHHFYFDSPWQSRACQNDYRAHKNLQQYHFSRVPVYFAYQLGAAF